MADARLNDATNEIDKNLDDIEAKKLSESLNGYLNIYKNHMMTSLRAIDFFNNINI